MPIEFEFRSEECLAVFRHVGEVPDDEFLASYRDVFDDPDLSACRKLLIDLGQTNSAPRSSRALRDLADLFREKLAVGTRPRKVAVIAPTDLSFGLARMYEVFSDSLPWEFAVFRDGEAARAWLGVSGSAGSPS
ncbi:MAG: hypothetical protein JXR77_19615 [Lentisphaeria bacterium]|nr:hypothetical protein [Lentisphaeria bacterium]